MQSSSPTQANEVVPCPYCTASIDGAEFTPWPDAMGTRTAICPCCREVVTTMGHPSKGADLQIVTAASIARAVRRVG